MGSLGFTDVKVTEGGADRGLDVDSVEAVAQVKHLKKAVGVDAIRIHMGVAARERKQAVFYSLNGYTSGAVSEALQGNVALFVYSDERVVLPYNRIARLVARRERKPRVVTSPVDPRERERSGDGKRGQRNRAHESRRRWWKRPKRRRALRRVIVTTVVLATGALASFTLATRIGRGEDGGVGPRGESAITRQEFELMGESWPFVVDAGILTCHRGGTLTFTVDGVVYALDGVAKDDMALALAEGWRTENDLGEILNGSNWDPARWWNLRDVNGAGEDLCDG